MSLSISADDPSQQESVDLNEGDNVKDLTTDAGGSDDDEPIASNAVPVYTRSPPSSKCWRCSLPSGGCFLGELAFFALALVHARLLGA
jgi:hypothetical protein